MSDINLQKWHPEFIEKLIDYKDSQTQEDIYKIIVEKFPKTPIQCAFAIAKCLSQPEPKGQCIWDADVGIPPQCSNYGSNDEIPTPVG